MGRQAAEPGEARRDVGADPFHQVLFENEALRVLRVEIPPGQATTLHRHDRDYVMIVLEKAQVREERPGSVPAVWDREGGQATLLEGGFVHRVHNLGAEPFRAVLVEVKR